MMLGVALFLPAHAGTVHKWVDADGVTHYSDDPPQKASGQVTSIEIEAPGSRAASHDADYYSIANQWQRVHRERLEREKIALEKARVKAARESSQREVRAEPEPRESRYVVGHRGYYPHYRPGHPYQKIRSHRGRTGPGLHRGRNIGIGGYNQ